MNNHPNGLFNPWNSKLPGKRWSENKADLRLAAVPRTARR
jgi:hypothetical protein